MRRHSPAGHTVPGFNVTPIPGSLTRIGRSTRTLGLVHLAVGLALGTATQAWSRPRTESLPILQAADFVGEGTDLPRGANLGVFTTAQGGTTWFGGTVWAADSTRWEAIEGDVWTFDTGVGSSVVPPGGPKDLSFPTRAWVNPYKLPGLHATMEGWIGVDNTYSEIPYFRRLSSADPRWGTVCVGSAAGLGGMYSAWCGVFGAEADSMCYAGGQGYGNSWAVCIEHPFSYDGVGGVTLGFAYKSDTEENFDFTIVYVDTTGAGDDVEATSFTGTTSGTANVTLTQGIELPWSAGPIKIKFCFQADGAWSDQDGLHLTTCGAFAVDDISVTGGGILHSADFESSDDGWTRSASRPGIGGEWAQLEHLGNLPSILAACPCPLADSVLVLFDDANGHNLDQDNLASSPWIDLKAAGLNGAPGKILATDVYAELPLLNYIFIQLAAQWYPDVCFTSGKLVTSPWTSDGFFYNFGGTPRCSPEQQIYPGFLLDFSVVIPEGAEQVRMALGVRSICRFFANCTGITNTTPWFDNARFGVYGSPGAPSISVVATGLPQDNFPENGTVNLTSPGRMDCNDVQGDSEAEVLTTLGDTLVIRGGVGEAEVYVHFRVIPGPGVNAGAFDAWWNKHAESPYEGGFKAARCDSAERGGTGPTGRDWMTAYHEADPNFTGTDRDIDGADQAPNGGLWRLKNDIFPDDLFTAGSRIEIFYTANTIGRSAYNRVPSAPFTYEMEILPSSMTTERSWNCVLYVDHFGGGAQGYIESALAGILGTGSANVEGTNWDRFDVNAPTSRQMSFGRPLSTEYGASVLQALAYKVILWNTGNLNSHNLSKEDADVLIPWLTLRDFDYNKLYLTGDGIVYSPVFEEASEPSARRLLEDIAGVTLRANCSQGGFRSANCPVYGEPEDATPCVDLDPVVNAPVAGGGSGRSVGHAAQGNGCPELRSFDVLDRLTPDFGEVTADERYSSPIKAARFASTVTDASSSQFLHYRIVVDGVSVHYRRDRGTPCDYTLGGTTAVGERLDEVLSYFGFHAGYMCPLLTGVEDEVPSVPEYRVALVGMSPNPLQAGQGGVIGFTLARHARAVIEIYDLQGRRVKTVSDGIRPAGENEAVWNGTDEAGSKVGSGVYFVRLRAEGMEFSSRVVVIRGG